MTGAALCLAAAPALAADEKKSVAYPSISGTVPVEIQGDRIYHSDSGTARKDVFLKVEPAATIRFTSALSLDVGLTLEEVIDPDPANEDRVFEDEGLYLKTFRVAYDFGRFGVFGGKFTSTFGIAHDSGILPGLYSADMAKDYELAERIGLGGTLAVAEGGAGTHTLVGSVFARDTTSFSRSVFTNRGRTRPDSGGPANTESLESVTVALEGENVAGVKELRYQLAVARQAVDRVNDDTGAAKAASAIDDETALALSVRYRLDVGKVAIAPLVEWVHINDFGGDKAVDRDYVTGGLGFEYGKWNAAVAYTRRNTDNPSAADLRDYQVQLSAGYRFDTGIGVELGWKQIEESNARSRFAGFKLTYGYDF